MRRRILLAAPLLAAAAAEDVMPPDQRGSEPLDESAVSPDTLAFLSRAEAHLRARLEPRFGPLRAIHRQVHFGLVNGIGAHYQARMQFDRGWERMALAREGELAGLFPLAGWWREARVLCVIGRTEGGIVPYTVLTNLRDG